MDTKQGDRELVPLKVRPHEKEIEHEQPKSVEELPAGWWKDLQEKNRKWRNL